ncbi:MAG: hypothetical protein LBI55_01700 [Oscillospiraceae bacterium]|jgi:chromosome segregation ATPase|nr:hypothetical protein [Oscillospiraceae bacterium]
MVYTDFNGGFVEFCVYKHQMQIIVIVRVYFMINKRITKKSKLGNSINNGLKLLGKGSIVACLSAATILSGVGGAPKKEVSADFDDVASLVKDIFKAKLGHYERNATEVIDDLLINNESLSQQLDQAVLELSAVDYQKEQLTKQVEDLDRINQGLIAKNQGLFDENQVLIATNQSLSDENQKLSDKNLSQGFHVERGEERIFVLERENKNLKAQIQLLVDENQNLAVNQNSGSKQKNRPPQHDEIFDTSSNVQIDGNSFDEITELRLQLDKANQEIQRLNLELEKSGTEQQGEIDRLQRDCQSLSDENRKLRYEVEEERRKVIAVKEEDLVSFEEKDRAIQELNEQVSNFQNYTSKGDKEIDTLNSRLNEVNQENEYLKSEIDKNKEQINEQQSELNKFGENYQNLQAENQNLTEAARIDKDNILALEQNKEVLHNEIETLKFDLNEVRQENEELKLKKSEKQIPESFNGANQISEELQKEVEELNENLLEKENEISKLEDENLDLKKEFFEAETNLKIENSKLQKQSVNLFKEVKQKEETIKGLEEQISKLQNEIDNARTEASSHQFDEANQKIERLTSELNKVNEERIKYEEDLRDRFDQKYQKLQAENQRLDEVVRTGEDSILTLTQDNEALRKEIEILKSDFDAASQQIGRLKSELDKVNETEYVESLNEQLVEENQNLVNENQALRESFDQLIEKNNNIQNQFDSSNASHQQEARSLEDRINELESVISGLNSEIDQASSINNDVIKQLNALSNVFTRGDTQAKVRSRALSENNGDSEQ